MALLAYEEPEKSPMFHLLSSDYWQNIADCLNQAILGMLTLWQFPVCIWTNLLSPSLDMKGSIL